MRKRNLGHAGLQVSALGLGCMGMSWAYGQADEAESLRTLHRSLELGINFWDTAEMYGPFTNEALLGKALKSKRQDVILATKFAWRFDSNGKRVALDSSPANIRQSIEGSLRRLGTDYIDLYYQHRIDPNTPIEDTVGAMAELVEQGKVRYIGLSEVGPSTIRKAHAVHPLTAVQSEYSLWERSIEARVLPTLHQLDIGLVAYSPMGRGFLTGGLSKPDDLSEDDGRRNHPRFQEQNFARNMSIVEGIRAVATRRNATPAQITLAWLLAQGNDIVPIPGTKRVKYLEENARAESLALTERDVKELDDIVNAHPVAGERYPEEAMRMIGHD